MNTNRHYGMDWLRIGAFALLIFYHIGMYFVPWGWHVKTPHPMDWVQIPMMATNSWRLPLLFLVSGYASAALFAKLGGVGPFLRSRSARLLIPLAFGMIAIIPVQPWIELVTQHDYAGGFLHFWSRDYFGFGTLEGIVLPTWQHLWFVVYLFVYTLLAAMVLAAIPERARVAIADGAARLLAGWGMLFVPLAAWLTILFAFPGYRETHALFDDGPNHLHYLVPFFIGWLLRVRPALFDTVARCWPVAAVVAIAAYGYVAWALWAAPGEGPPPEGVVTLFMAIRLVQGWAAIVALVGVADRFANRDHPGRAMLAEAVFPFYIIHQTIIVLVGYWLLLGGVGPLASFLVLVAATIAGCWAFYLGGRRVGWLRPLIGLQRKARDRPTALCQPSANISGG
ncbi:acyltransferase family protein [Sphingopyxis indica]|uniref:Surface polysaccharide O-acyltransferase, integral membrane enzyme n=1 Tax=Sphingopyxis indica TaxID=436663 RepID=A0A239J0B1_9SPHN|nr:acyltransferase family protein [Sphingopyxis indica]SNS99239.1 Surface polysaccharide O-acyltransferase, integral membrane enzyme [Sphingopyxis indica]